MKFIKFIVKCLVTLLVLGVMASAILMTTAAWGHFKDPNHEYLMTDERRLDVQNMNAALADNYQWHTMAEFPEDREHIEKLIKKKFHKFDPALVVNPTLKEFMFMCCSK